MPYVSAEAIEQARHTDLLPAILLNLPATTIAPESTTLSRSATVNGTGFPEALGVHLHWII